MATVALWHLFNRHHEYFPRPFLACQLSQRTHCDIWRLRAMLWQSVLMPWCEWKYDFHSRTCFSVFPGNYHKRRHRSTWIDKTIVWSKGLCKRFTMPWFLMAITLAFMSLLVGVDSLRLPAIYWNSTNPMWVLLFFSNFSITVLSISIKYRKYGNE